MFLIILFVIIVIFLVELHYSIRGKRAKFIDQIPGPKTLPILGNFRLFYVSQRNLWNIVRKINIDYYPINRLWSLDIAVVNLCSAEYAEILLSTTDNINKGVLYELLKPWLGTGLLTSGRKKWHKRRKMLTPAFHFNILQSYMNIIDENNIKTIEALKSEPGEIIKSLVPFTAEHALNVICEAAMGTPLTGLKSQQKEYRTAIQRIVEIMLYLLGRPWYPRWFSWFFLKSAKGQELTKILNILHGFSRKIIKERKQYHEQTKGYYLQEWNNKEKENGTPKIENDIYGVKKKRLAMLDLLISVFRKGDIDDDGIREEVDTFMFEGHDTTTMGICFTLLILAEHKDIQHRCREEVNQVFNESGERMGLNEMQRLSYLDRCIKEALRLYPSVPFISRFISKDTKFGEYIVPRGTQAHLHIWDVHRDPKHWPDPTKYDPDRFLPERIQSRHPYSYIPFSGGPRNCIGQRFAVLEIKSLIAHLLHNFHLEPIDFADQVPILPDLVLRPMKPVHIKFVPIVTNQETSKNK